MAGECTIDCKFSASRVSPTASMRQHRHRRNRRVMPDRATSNPPSQPSPSARQLVCKR
ncbi:hypothetical protein FM112_09625 [Gulosibacter sp. 10]|nr:hypothetical protein FM112_09625 [Gulosibacter sp. 10]